MRFFLPIVMILLISGIRIKVSAQQTIILPEVSLPADTRKIEQCRKTVEKINSIELRCDTVLLFSHNNGEFYRFQGLFFDKNGRVRKYVSEQQINDGAHECGKTSAYYDKSGSLVYIERESSNNCENSDEYFYLDNGLIIDFRCFEYCGCCDEEYFREEYRPWIGATLSEINSRLEDYSNIKRMMDYSSDDGDRSVNAFLPNSFPKGELPDIQYFDNIQSIKGIVRDSIEKPKAYLISTNSMERIAVYKDGRYAVFNVIPDKSFNSYEFTRANIDGVGNDELVIRWKMQVGRSGKDDGFTVDDSGVLVWDLDTFTCLLDLLDKRDYNFWWKDPHGEGGQREYMKHDVSLGKKSLTIRRGTQYDIGNTIFHETVPAFKYVYKFSDTGFILDKIVTSDTDLLPNTM